MKNKISQKDLSDIVNIHFKTLGDDLLPQLGKNFLLRFYQYIDNSELEEIFIIKDEHQVIASCIISWQPNTILQRVVKKIFIYFIYALIINIVTNKKLFSSALKIFLNKTRFISQSPEIVYIFTNPMFQGKGIGKNVIEKVENSLRNKKINKYYVKTLNDKENKAINFYLKNGFKEIKSFNYAGNVYLYLEKCLDV